MPKTWYQAQFRVALPSHDSRRQGVAKLIADRLEKNAFRNIHVEQVDVPSGREAYSVTAAHDDLEKATSALQEFVAWPKFDVDFVSPRQVITESF